MVEILSLVVSALAVVVATTSFVYTFRQKAALQRQMIDYQTAAADMALEQVHLGALWNRRTDAYVRIAQWLSQIEHVAEWDDLVLPDPLLVAELDVIADFSAYSSLKFFIGQLWALSDQASLEGTGNGRDAVNQVRLETLRQLRGKTHDYKMTLRDLVQSRPQWREPVPIQPTDNP